MNRTPPNAEVAGLLEHLGVLQQGVRDQLAVLRATRGQRAVGAVTVPVHLQVPIPLDDRGVTKVS
jgi:hypothetical protein